MSKITELFSSFPRAIERPLKGDRTSGHFKPRRGGEIQAKRRKLRKRCFLNRTFCEGNFQSPLVTKFSFLQKFFLVRILLSSPPRRPRAEAEEWGSQPKEGVNCVSGRRQAQNISYQKKKLSTSLGEEAGNESEENVRREHRPAGPGAAPQATPLTLSFPRNSLERAQP